jgi:[ribosomal protein S18]-alanine N-acetyltransferase
MNPDGAMEIVPMTLEDIPAVLEIERSAHVQPWPASFFVEEMQRPHSRACVARLKETTPADKVLGYICFWIVADEVQIFNLAVDTGHRRRGIGKALLLHALEVGYHHRARIAVLEVRRGNDAARRLYGSVGFQAVAERYNYYSELRESALLMELEMDRAWVSQWLAKV